MEKIQDTVTRLNQMRKKIQIIAIIFLAILVLIAIVSLHYPKVGIAGAVVLAVYYFVFLRGQVKKYQKEFIYQTLVHGTCRECTDIVYDRNKNSQEALQNSPMLPLENKGTVSLWHGFTANCRKHSMTVNEASCNFQFEGPNGKTQIQSLTGTAVCMNAQSLASVGSVIIYDRSLLNGHTEKVTGRGSYELKDLPEGLDQERFVVFAPNGSQPQLDANFLSKLSALAGKIEKPFCIYLKEGQMQALLGGCFYAQEVAIKYEVTDKALWGNRLPELAALITFAN